MSNGVVKADLGDIYYWKALSGGFYGIIRGVAPELNLSRMKI